MWKMDQNQSREGDAFIGLDIDLQDEKPSAAHTSNTQSRKRSRSRSTPTAAKRPRRPPPTPAPPAALVSLIQGNVAVLNYFKSLQANLDYDVDKWKAEAQRWKKIAQDKPSNGKQIHKTKKSPISLRVKTERSLSNNESNPLKEDKDGDSNNIPITDEALFGESDDSDDQSNCNTEMHANVKVDQGNISDNKRASTVLDKLKEAKQCLDSLGVSLVEVEVKTTIKPALELADNCVIKGCPENDDDCGKSTDTVPSTLQQIQTTTIERILHRQSDEKVAGEIMASLKALIKTYSCISESHATTSKHIDNEKLQDDTENNIDNHVKYEKTNSDTKVVWTQMMRRYHPFCQSGQFHMPTVYMPNQNASLQDDVSGILPVHPAAIGLNHIIKILTIMGMYCNDALSDSEWDAIFQNEIGVADSSDKELLLVLKVGMRNRCRITNRVMSTLNVEITRNWALADRISYLTEPSLLFHASDVIDGNEPEPTKAYPPKLYNRLVSLEERIAHARIASVLYRQRDDWQKAAELVLGYVLSCAPSIGVEDYPKLPPALSLCVLEALLSREIHCALDYQKSTIQDEDRVEGWFPQYIHFLISGCDDLESKSEKVSMLLEAIAYPIHTSVSIWKERSFCSDPRIRDVAMIELAAFQRIRQSADAQWIDKINVDRFDADVITKVCSNALNSAKDLLIAKTNYLDNAFSGIVCALSLLTLGDIDKVMSLCKDGMVSLGDHPSKDGKSSQLATNMSIMTLCCSVYVSLVFRKWDALKLRNREGSSRHTAAAFTMEDRFTPILQSSISLMNPMDWGCVDTLLRCCVLIGDGRNLLQIANDALPSLMKATLGSNQSAQSTASRTMTTFVDVGELPTVRLINLKRRPDRLLDFMSIASREQVIVIKGPSAINKQCNGPEEYAGHYAFDGNCTLDELKAQLGSDISEYVTADWRPGDLRAFDRKARKTNDLVQSSMTEKCCAMSHIASWIGVKSSLSEFSSSSGAEG